MKHTNNYGTELYLRYHIDIEILSPYLHKSAVSLRSWDLSVHL